jgi:DNA-directed RNA polymerase subunit RPC12/RpoP
MTTETHGPVDCPYCGHQIIKRVAYEGQKMTCQKCTSKCTAPLFSGDGSGGMGCITGAILIFVGLIGTIIVINWLSDSARY